MKEHLNDSPYLREGLTFPFCVGCGCITVLSNFLRAVQELGHKDLRRFVFCSGIGCSAWIPSPYLEADSLHVTHGRSIPVATGIKLLRPDLNVVVFGGDGDLAGIGLSHLVHAARRNLDITVIMVNNMIYGMTGGQVAPTTPFGTVTTTTPYGSFEPSLDVTRLMVAAGACFAARWTTTHGKKLKENMKKAVATKGFAFIEVISPCPTAFGRKAGFKNVKDMHRWFKQNSVRLEEATKLTETELVNKIIVGEYASRRAPSLWENLQRTLQREENHA